MRFLWFQNHFTNGLHSTFYFTPHTQPTQEIFSLFLQTMHKEKVVCTQKSKKVNHREHKLNGTSNETSNKSG